MISLIVIMYSPDLLPRSHGLRILYLSAWVGKVEFTKLGRN
jgi:hypothetical protein